MADYLTNIDFVDIIAEFIWEILDTIFSDMIPLFWNDIVGNAADFVWTHMTLTLCFVLLVSLYTALERFGGRIK